MAAEPLDVDAQRRVHELVRKATQERQQALDPALLRDIKGLCKTDDENVRSAYAAIAVALKSRHSQPRLMAVELADVLFQRSRVFRGLLAPDLTTFLAKTVGYRKEDPLPPPAAAAAALRDRSLAVLEGWNSKFGSLYHQVALGCSYLKRTLKYEFPDATGRATAAQIAERRAALASYQRIEPEFDATLREMDICALQLREALALAEAPSQSVAAAEADERAMGWADALPGDDREDGDGGGIAGYGADEASFESQEGDTSSAAVMVPADAAADPAVGESIVGCVRLLAHRHLPTLRTWLDVFVKVNAAGEGAPTRAAVDACIHAALQRRSDLTKLLAEAGAARVRVPGLAAALDEASVARTPAPDQATAARGAAAEQGRRSSTLSPEEEAELVAIAERHAQLKHAAAPQSSWTLDGRFKGRQGAAALTPAQMLVSSRASQPHRSLTAAAPPPRSCSPAAAEGLKPPPRKRGGADAQEGGALPDRLKHQLLQSAPVVPAGGHLHYWDSGSGSASAANSGMEISNHWGAVDRDTQVTLAQLEGMAVNHVAQYYTPERKSAKAETTSTEAGPAPARPPAAPGMSTAETPKHLNPKPGVTRLGGGALPSRLSLTHSSIGAAASPDPGIEALERLLEQQKEQEAKQQAEAAAAATGLAAVAADRQAAAQPATAAPAAAESTDGTVSESGASGRKSLTGGSAAAEEAAAREEAAVRVHRLMAGPRGAAAFNAAILAGATTDEDVARALGAAAMEESTGGKGCKRKAAKPPVVAAKLKKLLTAKHSEGPKHSIPGKGHAWFR